MIHKDNMIALLKEKEASHHKEVELYLNMIEDYKRELEGWKASYEGQKDNTLAFCDDIEKIKKKLEDIECTTCTECDIQTDRTWANQYHCSIHGVWFRDYKKEVLFCPCGEIEYNIYKIAKGESND